MSNTCSVLLRVVTLGACLLPSLLLAGCGGGSSSTPATPVNTGPVTSAPRTANGLQYTLTADKSVYKVGEAVNLTYTLTNVSSQSVSETVGSPGVIVTVMQGSQLVWRTPQPPIYGGGGFGTGFGLPPSSSHMYTATWPQTATNSGKQVAAGQYFITAILNDESSDHQPTNPIQVTVAP